MSKPTGDAFVWWWLGGFACTGALVAGTLAAVSMNGGVLGSLGIAFLGATLGLAIGSGIAWVLVLIAEELGWDEQPPSSRIRRLVEHPT